MSAASQPTLLLQVSQAVDVAVIAAAVAVLARQRHQRRAPATGWALAMFSILGGVVIAGWFGVVDDGSWLNHAYTVVLICLLLLVPYLLVQFAASLGAVGKGSVQVAGGLTLVQLALTVASPPFPKPGDPRSGYFIGYVVVVLVSWTFQSVLAAVGLWRAGNGQPSVVRQRMRCLSTGAIVVALDLVVSGGSGNPSQTTQVVTTLVGVAGLCLLVLAFVVPGWLRAAWRAADLVELGSAERRLMTATTAEAVAQAVVPAVVRLLGAEGAALVDGAGRPVVARSMTAEQVAAVYREVLADDRSELTVLTGSGAFGCRLTDGWLLVQAGVFAPLFGAAELSLLDRVGSFADLALQRCRLFDQEARSRAAAEAANAELQTLVYSVSHDLRNPIISVLGYLDVLAQEHAGQLQGEGPHYLERISVNVLYMQSLIQDLLELSRIGRSEPPPQEVAFGAMAESVAQEVRGQYPSCDVVVSGSFPVLWMSELRARQLLTNLLDNAAKHGGVDAHVEVNALPDGAGGVLLLVADNGPGVAPEHREKAFEVFERLGAAHRDIPGTGMGLPICKRIVESLGGTISLDGPVLGNATGATVRVAVPVAAVRSWSPPVPASTKEPSSS